MRTQNKLIALGVLLTAAAFEFFFSQQLRLPEVFSSQAQTLMLQCTIVAIVGLLIYLRWNVKSRKVAETASKNLTQILQNKTRQFKLIIEAQQAVGTCGLEHDVLLGIVLKHVEIITNASSTIYEEIDGDHLVYRSARGKGLDFLDFRILRKGSFSGLCIESVEVLICDDTELDPRVNLEAYRRVNIRSLIVAPLIHNDVVIGVIKAASENAGHFQVEQKDALTLMTGLLSAALNSSTAFEEEKRSVESLRRAEQDLILARDDAQKATRTKSEFLANVSHEIRTPLNGVLGMTSLLLDSTLTIEQRSHAESVRISAQNLLTIINDLLDFSKIEAGKIEFESMNFDVCQLLNDIERTIRFSAEQKGLIINIVPSKDLPPSLVGDPTRLGQILLNLVSNAIKFTHAGSVSVRAAATLVHDDRYKLRFEVSDTGIGIPKAIIEKLFQAFTQADSSTTRRFGGTGLGLSISKHLVQLMGGEIGVDSIDDQGSTFWFTVELKCGAELAIPKQILGNVNFITAQKLRILVAEDNAVNQIIVLKMLEKIGHTAEVAADGEEALDMLRESRYDVVLMDCQMPELDGFQTTQIIRKSLTLGMTKIPIIAMTANAMRGDREKCIASGMDNYISKPLKLETLFSVLEETMALKGAA